MAANELETYFDSQLKKASLKFCHDTEGQRDV